MQFDLNTDVCELRTMRDWIDKDWTDFHPHFCHTQANTNFEEVNRKIKASFINILIIMRKQIYFFIRSVS
jgi:hypothetical protein